jgi:endonuclease III
LLIDSKKAFHYLGEIALQFECFLDSWLTESDNVLIKAEQFSVALFASRKVPSMAKLTLAQRSVPELLARLQQLYPEPQCELTHDSPLQLLVATILSAQCTDQRVNMVTPELFRTFPTALDLADAPLAKLEKLVQSTGFFRNKAKNIQACCRLLVEEHQGQVPTDLEALVKLPGVGRKTANVVLGTAFRIASGVVVDTHVGRLSRRIGLTKNVDAVKVEQDLNRLLPQTAWIDFSHQLILHGRRVCSARKPLCEQCALVGLCQQVGVKTTAQKKTLETKTKQQTVKSPTANKRRVSLTSAPVSSRKVRS